MTWALRAGGWLGVGNDSVYVKSRCFDPFPFPDLLDDLKTKIRAVAEELDGHRKARLTEHPGLTLTQMYNVLEKLRAGDVLDETEERIKKEGVVRVLKELHDKLDGLVIEAYGWASTLSDEEILGRLLALNQERATEERAGKIRWLRPEYQIPRLGSDAERARLEEQRRSRRVEGRQVALDFGDDLQELKRKFPTDDELAETVAVVGVLDAATEPLGIETIARHFAQGRQIEKRVALTIRALMRLGHLWSPDGGQSFALRRGS